MSFKNETVETGDLKKIRELIQNIDVAMLTTVNNQGLLHSRPMATQPMSDDGRIYFFVDASSGKVNEISSVEQVNIVYSQSSENRYISISGRAVVTKDKQKISQLWQPNMKAWFSEGLEDPSLGLLEITIEQAEYWDYAGTVTEVIGLAKALTTGYTYSGNGTHGRFTNM